ncbi:MAG TPA: TetR family transcriptional regulator [Mycobacterium sp.]|nr:TetR family transcriptional regulator [Mycobacterium sp.]
MSQADWRADKKARTRSAIQEQALRLFAEKGYDATTVEDIAAAAGVSHMTFFRYFPRKEEVVEYDEYDPMLAELVAARPPDESPLQALHGAVRSGLEAILPTDGANVLARTRLVLRNPTLRGRNWVAQDATIDVFATALARRSGLPSPNFATTALAAAALGAMNVAITEWAKSDGADLLVLTDAAFAALEAGGD